MADIKKIILDSLRIPVIDLFDPILPPCATWYPTNENAGLNGDGKEEERLESYQIDVWDRDREMVRTRGRKLKAELMMMGEAMSIPDLSYQYDNNGKIWRATLTFSLIGKE